MAGGRHSAKFAYALLLLFILAFSALLVVQALIHCEGNGVCSGDGEPDGVTSCGNCHSCTFKGCCHRSFTNPFTHCSIPGYRSSEYRGGR